MWKFQSVAEETISNFGNYFFLLLTNWCSPVTVWCIFHDHRSRLAPLVARRLQSGRFWAVLSISVRNGGHLGLFLAIYGKEVLVVFSSSLLEYIRINLALLLLLLLLNKRMIIVT